MQRRRVSGVEGFLEVQQRKIRKEWGRELPETIDWNKSSQHPRRTGRRLMFLIAIVAVILLFGRTAVSYWVDLLWFKSLGYEQVFWKSRGLEWGIFAGFLVMTFLILYGIFSALKHAHGNDLPGDHTIYFNGNPVTFSLKPVLRFVSIGGSLVVALLTGGTMASEWQTFALWWYAPRGGAADPIFGRPLDFYLFTLPAWQLILGWLLTLSVIACLLAALFLLVSGGARALSQTPQS